MGKYKGLVISDIHVGAMDLDKLHNEYLELFIHKIYTMKKLDFVIVTGDFFDHKFYLNDKESSMAYIMLRELVLACKEKDAIIRLVYGTESHECNQYDILSLLKIYDKIEVVKYVKDEELLPGLKVLYIPEEHVNSKTEYYHDYFENDKEYDYVFGHGVIREVMKDIAVHVDNSTSDKTKRKKVPVFNTSELSRICKGQVYFGHYHMNAEYNDKIFSVSSFSRWVFGEEGRKGFYLVDCDTSKHKYHQEFIENTMADAYKTVSFGYENDIFKNETDLQDTLSGLDQMLVREPYRHMRFVFNIPTNVENPEATINYIKERYKYNEHIKVEITNGYVEEKRKAKKEKVQEDNDKYIFIFDKNSPLEDKVSKFLEIKFDKNITTKRISSYLYKTLNEILEEVYDE